MPIALRRVTFSYEGKAVLRDFTMEFPESGVVCLFGPSGCGKTTVLRLLAGLEQPDEGRLEGLENQRVSMVFQENRLLPWMSLLDNVTAVLTGPETRTSSPVRILRGEGCESPGLPGLYPCGEGAGYAGGIMSAAVDGIRVAQEIMKKYRPD